MGKKMLTRFFRDVDNTTDMMIRQKSVSARPEVTEKPDSFEISIVLPTGMEAKDVSLELLNDDQVLHLSGENKVEKDNILSQSRISRMFKMGNNADTDNISAKLFEGVLHVTVPKLEKKEEKQSKKIDIVQESPAPVTEQEVENEEKQDVKDPSPDDVVMTKSESVKSDKEEAGYVKVKDDDMDVEAKVPDASTQEE